MTTSRLSGFYRMSVDQRIDSLISNGFLAEDDANALREGAPLLPTRLADQKT